MPLQNRIRTPHHLLEMVLKRNDSLFQQRIDRLNLFDIEAMHAILAIHQLDRSIIMNVFIRHWRVIMNALNRGAAYPDAISLVLPFGNRNIARQESVLADDHFQCVAKEVQLVFLQQEVLPEQKSLEEKLICRGEIGVRDEEIGGQTRREVLSKPIDVLIDEIERGRHRFGQAERAGDQIGERFAEFRTHFAREQLDSFGSEIGIKKIQNAIDRREKFEERVVRNRVERV